LNKINPRKLLNSKWTTVTPLNREKHFMVTKVVFDEVGEIADCEIEAVLTSRTESIDWQALKNEAVWLQGWK